MEGVIARLYARSTAGRDHRKSAELVVGQVASGSSVLEVAPGSGYLAIELTKLGTSRVVGLDITQSFIEIATANAKDAGVDIAYHHGKCGPHAVPSGLL